MRAGLVGDRYEVLRVVTRGRASELVQALDLQHNRPVALRIRRLTGDADREVLLAEGRSLLSLGSHAAVPTVRDDFFLDDRYVLVMDWVEGTDLGVILAEQGDPGLSIATVLGWLPSVGAALDHLHSHRPPIVHGDVSPEKIILSPDGRVSLVFGVGDVRPSDPAEDIYGLGSTALRLLTGRAAGPGEPVSWEGVAPELAKRLDRVLRRALHPDPLRRHASAGELVDRLANARESVLPTGVVTFVLTDIEGSTALWEQHPGAMAGVIARHHDLAADIVEAHGGRMPRSQGEGDSTLAAFARASDAVTAAVAFQRAMRTEPWPEGIRLMVRTGLHTGEAQIDRGDYLGAAVSRTARVRGLAHGGEILMSQATAELIADVLPPDLSLRELGRFDLKGLTRAEHLYQLTAAGLDVVSDPDRADPGTAATTRHQPPFPSGLEPTSAVFVGRDTDLAALRASWERALGAEQRRIVLLGGDPGIGKSRLACELARQVYLEGATVLYGRCYEDSLVPYQPFVEAIGHFLRAGPTSEMRAEIVRSGTMLARLLPDIALRFPDLPEAIRAEPGTERYLMFEAADDLLVGLSRRAPLLVVLDDLHWADHPTIALLAHLAHKMDAAPLMVLGTYRIGEVVDDHPLRSTIADLRREHVVDEVALTGMAEDEIAELIATLGESDPSPEFLTSVLRETDGNPFFVQEICRHVGESGIRAGGFTLGALGVPEDVKQVIRHRIARLDEAGERALEAAAVIGRDFDLDVLVEVTHIDEDDAVDLLDQACAARLLQEVKTDPGRYSFVHALTREAIYDSLGVTRRARLHRRVAEAIEALRADQLDDHLGALAHHYAEAGTALARAVEYARRAGVRALTQLAHEEAVVQFERGLTLLTGHDRAECDLLLGLAEARRRSGDVPGSQEAFARAGALARKIGDAERLARAAVGSFRGHVLARPAWHEPVIGLLEEALEALSDEDTPLRSRVLAALSLELFFTDDRHRGAEISAQGVDMARRVGDDDGLAFALACRHTAISDPDHLENRLAVATELVEVSGRVGNVELALIGHIHRASDFLELGRVDEARAEAAVCSTLVDELGQPVHRYFVIWLQSTLALLGGRFDEAQDLSNQALEVGLAAGHPDAMIVFGSQAVVIGWQRGDLSHLVEQAEKLLDELPDLRAWRGALALVMAMSGRTAAAETHLRVVMSDLDLFTFSSNRTTSFIALVEVARILGADDVASVIHERLAPYAGTIGVISLSLSEMGPISRSLGVLETMIGDFAAAEASFHDALELSTRITAPPHTARASVDYARMLVARRGPGDTADALTLLNEAKPIATQLGMAGLLADIRDCERELTPPE